MVKKKAVPTADTALKSAVGFAPVYQHNRGTIKDNAVFALLGDQLFRHRVEKKLKGKGSYQRKAKHAGKYFEKPDYQGSMWVEF